jgi:tetratricopeptide (TPR) repeat protein
VGVLVVTAVIYWRTADYDFTSYDDPIVLLDRHRIRSLANLPAIWTKSHKMDFFPITETSYAIEYALVKYEPMLYHVTNVGLHLACTGAVFALAWMLGLGTLGSAVAAAAFGFHPIHVESVAWIADRKDLLAGLFGTLSILGFVAHDRRGNFAIYWIAILLGIAAILSKPSAVSIGASVFVVQFVIFQVCVRRAVLRSLPLLIIGLVFSGIIFWMHYEGGNVRPETVTRPQQWLLAVYGFAFPLWKFIWPFPLLPYYEKQVLTLGQEAAWGALATLLICGVITWWNRKNVWVLMAMGWYLMGILPVLRYVDVGFMSVADRYMYWPSIGLCLMIGAGIRHAWTNSNSTGMRTTVGAITISAMIGLLSLTHNQIPAWENSETVWNHVRKHNPQSPKAYNGLGEAASAQAKQLSKIGDLQAAATQTKKSVSMYTEAIRLSPHYIDAYYNRGLAWSNLREIDEALKDFSTVIRIQPDHALSYNNRGNVYVLLNQIDRALADYNKAIEYDPEPSMPYANRGNIWRVKQEYEKAFEDFQRAIQLDDANAIAYHNRAVAHFFLKEYASAWDDLIIAQQLGGDVNLGFLAALRQAMPEPTP